MFACLSNLENDKNKICNDGDTLEDFYRHAHLDETLRKFLDGLKERRENSPTEEKSPVMKKEINWGIQLVKTHETRPYSPLSIWSCKGTKT
jgi:hypothetical protein